MAKYHYQTREAYLHAATEKMRPWFETAGKPLPEHLHISVGFSRNQRALGSCWPSVASEDKGRHIFVDPTHKGDWSMLDTHLHELVHAALPDDAKHGKQFSDLCRKIGLVGPWRQAHADESTVEKLKALANKLGPVPHVQLQAHKAKRFKQATLMRLFHCACEKPFKIRSARLDLDCTCNVCGSKFELQD